MTDPSESGPTPRAEDSREWMLRRRRSTDEAGLVSLESDEARLRRQRRLNLAYVPLRRLIALWFVGLIGLPVHNLVIVDGGVPTGWPVAAAAIVLYPVFAWLALVAWWTPERGPMLAAGTMWLDLAALLAAVYYSGGSASWLFFVVLLRVADESHTNFRRSLAIAHAAALGYLLLVLYQSTVDDVLVSWPIEMSKTLFLYLSGVYLAITAIASEGRRKTLSSAVRLARGAIRDLELESRQLVLSREELKDQAVRDPLTNLLNRKGILDIVDRGLDRATTGSAPFAIVLVDLDGFKEVNDRFGHAVGDEVLKRVAGRMLASGRAFDAVGRIGGDEFLIALPNCDASGAVKLAERIRQAVGQDALTRDLVGSAEVSASLGVAAVDEAGSESSTDLVQRADRALYRAKAGGGDRIEVEPSGRLSGSGES